MASFKVLLFIYIFGGLTFVPLLVVALVALVWYTSPVVVESTWSDNSQNASKARVELDEATAETKKRHKTSTRLYRSGWVTVRRTFEPVADVGSDAGYMNMMASSYRSFVDSRSKDPRKSRPRDKYYAVLKDTVLFLYEDEQENDCYAAIKLPLHEVVMYPEDLIEGELFMKKNAICLKPVLKAGEDATEEVPSLILRPPPVNTNVNGTSNAPATSLESSASLSRQPWFIFPSINHDKEDWYHSLVSASKLPLASETAKDADLFDPNDMGNLVDAIDDQPDPIPTRWLNAMIGRLFFSVYRTSAVEDYIVRKIMRKLAKVNKPDFLGDIEVKEVDVGNTTPFFSKPMLKELTAEGDASMEVHIKYAGEFKIAISTTATLNLGQRFKSYSVKLVLAIILKDLEGNVLFKVKRPPSNRIWFGFTSPPKLGLRIEPVVSTRQIKWSLVTKPIESRLRELVAESIVLPHMDDIAFFDTKDYGQRGGIYGECARHASNLSGEAGEGMEPALETEESQIPPGVPNFKLGDPKDSTGDSVRQRHVRPRKSSTSESITSTRSVPVGAVGGIEKPSAFNLIPKSTSISLDQDTQESKHLKDKNHDHSRKKSWFNSTSNLAKGSLTATKSDSAASPPTAHKSEVGFSVPSREQDTLDSLTPGLTAPSARTSADSEDDEAALIKLKQRLEAGKMRPKVSGPESETMSETHLSSIPPLPRPKSEPPLMASPEPNLYKTSSSSSTDTTHPSGTNAIQSVPSDAAQQEMSSSKLPNLVRRKSDKSMSSSRSAASIPSDQNPFSDDAAVASGPDSASIHTNNSGTSSNIAILQNWKTKATDKQAIQAGVTQAREAVSKWGSKWQAYRQAHAKTEADEPSASLRRTPEEGDSVLSPQQLATVNSRLSSKTHDVTTSSSTIPRSIPKRDGKLTPEPRSRSSSLMSASPTGHFQPSAPTTTTSLSGPSTATSVANASSEALSQRSPTVRRVPPPSGVPIHPAVGADFERLPPPKPKSYTPAPRMSIPGIDDSRRFHASSADLPESRSNSSPLPSLKPGTQISGSENQSPRRVPPPSLSDADRDPVAAVVPSQDETSHVSSPVAVPPPLPARHAPTESLGDGGLVASIQTDPSSTGATSRVQGSLNPVMTHGDSYLNASDFAVSPELVVQPPTPSPGPSIEQSGVEIVTPVV